MERPWVKALVVLLRPPYPKELKVAFVDLEVLDLQGRRVATVLRQQASAAGPHQVAIRTDGWREGFYFCRFASAGRAMTRKMLVLR